MAPWRRGMASSRASVKYKKTRASCRGTYKGYKVQVPHERRDEAWLMEWGICIRLWSTGKKWIFIVIHETKGAPLRRKWMKAILRGTPLQGNKWCCNKLTLKEVVMVQGCSGIPAKQIEVDPNSDARVDRLGCLYDWWDERCAGQAAWVARWGWSV